MTEHQADVDIWFRAYGVEVDFSDSETRAPDMGRANVELRRGRSRQSVVLLYGPDVTLSSALEVIDHRPTVIATTMIGARRAAAFRRADIQYIDSAGNASLRFGDVFINVQGRRATTPPIPKPSAPISMFTPNRAKVVCALLTWKPLWNASRREVARAAGVSVGQAHQTLRALTELGYEGRSAESERLLDLWTASYPAGLARHLHLASFNGDPSRPIKTEHPIYISGERAVEHLLRPGSEVVYVPEFDARLPLSNRWRKDTHSNIVVRTAFWQDPYEDASAPFIRMAPWPLVYADLASSDDSRARDAATIWRARHA